MIPCGCISCRCAFIYCICIWYVYMYKNLMLCSGWRVRERDKCWEPEGRTKDKESCRQQLKSPASTASEEDSRKATVQLGRQWEQIWNGPRGRELCSVEGPKNHRFPQPSDWEEIWRSEAGSAGGERCRSVPRGQVCLSCTREILKEPGWTSELLILQWKMCVSSEKNNQEKKCSSSILKKKC